MQELAANKENLFALLIAGNYLKQTQLTELVGMQIAAYCIGKTTENLREYFGVESDFTPEEEKWHEEEVGFAM